jgi:hypothetical protein
VMIDLHDDLECLSDTSLCRILTTSTLLKFMRAYRPVTVRLILWQLSSFSWKSKSILPMVWCLSGAVVIVVLYLSGPVVMVICTCMLGR